MSATASAGLAWKGDRAGADIAANDVTYLQSLLSTSETSYDSSVRGYIVDLVEMVVSGKQQPFVLVSFFTQLTGPTMSESTHNLICDALWFWGTQVGPAAFVLV
jgi:hypothetical protein